MPWMLESSSGNLLDTVPALFKKYGDSCPMLVSAFPGSESEE